VANRQERGELPADLRDGLAAFQAAAYACRMTSPAHILGVILAGGQSRRFGGGDKGLADLGGRAVLSHVVERFRPQVGCLLLNVNGDPQRFAAFGLATIADERFPGLGPLSGILAALDWAARQAPESAAVATVSTDVPFLPDDLVAQLDAARDDGAAIAMSGERRHPTIAIWPLSARDAVADALRNGRLSADGLAAKLNAVAVPFAMRDIAGQAVDPFFNVNAPDDLTNARALMSKS
jgi:molybdopterin-guanine dinucleotide biosynthesis protein A